MPRFLPIILLVLGLIACKGPKEATTTTTKVPADFSLTLTRSGCMGTCPSYMVHVQADGKVFYEGYSFVSQVGKFTKEISQSRVQALITALEKANFWELKKAYDNPNISDLPGTTMKVTMDGKSHSVLDRFETPAVVQNLSVELDELIGMDGYSPFKPEE